MGEWSGKEHREKCLLEYLGSRVYDLNVLYRIMWRIAEKRNVVKVITDGSGTLHYSTLH